MDCTSFEKTFLQIIRIQLAKEIYTFLVFLNYIRVRSFKMLQKVLQI